jgi:hypothetical protein
MTVTDEMIDTAIAHKYGNIVANDKMRTKMRELLQAALATVKPMTMSEIDHMLCTNDHDNTYDLVESVEYWFGIRE